MTELYSGKWTHTNGLVPSQIWIEALGGLTDEQIVAGIDSCKKRIMRGNAWSPDLAEFLAASFSQDDSAEIVFNRLIDRSPKNEVEKYLLGRIGFNLRQMSINDGMRLLKGNLESARELERSHSLPSQKALAYKSTEPKFERQHEPTEIGFDTLAKIKKMMKKGVKNG